MHLRLRVPDDSPQFPGETWTPELARGFFGAHSGRSAPFLDSEIVRYLGWPGQAITYKLGERAWLAGRETGPGEPAAPSSTWPSGTRRRCHWARWGWPTWRTSCPAVATMDQLHVAAQAPSGRTTP
jgi:hypothetical protein